MLCPVIFQSNTIEVTVHTSCCLGLRLTLCYILIEAYPIDWPYKVEKTNIHGVQILKHLKNQMNFNKL